MHLLNVRETFECKVNYDFTELFDHHGNFRSVIHTACGGLYGRPTQKYLAQCARCTHTKPSAAARSGDSRCPISQHDERSCRVETNTSFCSFVATKSPPPKNDVRHIELDDSSLLLLMCDTIIIIS